MQNRDANLVIFFKLTNIYDVKVLINLKCQKMNADEVSSSTGVLPNCTTPELVSLRPLSTGGVPALDHLSPNQT